MPLGIFVSAQIPVIHKNKRELRSGRATLAQILQKCKTVFQQCFVAINYQRRASMSLFEQVFDFSAIGAAAFGIDSITSFGGDHK